MAGIGKYTKGKAFKLKSGNNPAFKMVGNTKAGDSPITNEFGVGKGTSPYRQTLAAKIGGALFSGAAGGLDAVYGSNISSVKKPSEVLKKGEKEITDKSPGEKFSEVETDKK